MRAGSFLEIDTGLFPLVAFTLFYACSRLYKWKKAKWQTTDALVGRDISAYLNALSIWVLLGVDPHSIHSPSHPALC